ncbi:MAG TPA: PIN domain-containing protein [Vicinamibacterales bacterium]|nr:PIN domain-containing protein [Vicinamibacterales bacterium]
MARALVDTNVLVYAHDPADRAKQERALAVLAALADAGAGCFSGQVLAEFYWTVTRGRRPLLTTKEAAEQVDRLCASWPVLDITASVVGEATAGVRDHRLSYWDAQVWAAARLNQVPMILSEDFADGSRLGGVRFLNPLKPGFDPSSLFVGGS